MKISSCWPLFGLALCASPAVVAQPLPLENAGFEDVGKTYEKVAPNGNGWTGEGTVARAWDDNSSWADVGVQYALDATNPHSGKSSQRVQVTRVGGGAAQFAQSVRFQKGHLYRFSVWLRATSSANLTVQFQQAPAPYHNYGMTLAGLSPEWRRFSVLGRAAEDTDAFLMLRASEPLTYFVDDATLEDLTNAVSDQKPQLGNLLPNGSFESGISGGWSARVQGDPAVVWRDLHLQSVHGATPVGGGYAQLTVAPDCAGLISAPLTPLRFGVPHTLSAWVRASKPETRLTLQLDGTELKSYPVVGTEWTRVSWTFTPPLLDSYRVSLYFPEQKGVGERTVALDGMMLEEGEKVSPAYVPNAPYEVTLTAPRLGNIFFPGERGVVRVIVSPPTLPPNFVSLRLSVTDAEGHIHQLPTQDYTSGPVLPAGSPQQGIWNSTVNLPFGTTQQGIWKLRVTMQDAQGKAVSAPTEMVWARVPRPKTLTDPAQSFFGLHIPFAPSYIGVARDLGQRFVRLHDSSMIGKWPIVEPQQGKFAFYDEQVNAAHAAGLAILGMLDGAPPWSSTKPREGGYWGIWNIPDKAEAPEEWRRYVSTVARHYAGKIDNWEVWNEPWGEWWIHSGNPNATPELYAKLMGIAHEEAHHANPKATVVGVDTFSGHDDAWTKPVLAKSGTGAFDVLSFHDYNDALAGGKGSRVENNAVRLRELQRAVGPIKPLWNTEGGPGNIGSFYAPETGGLTFSAQAAYMVRYDVASMAAGVKHFFVYAVHSGTAMGDPQYRALEHDYAPRPLLAARAVLASLVDGRATPLPKALGANLTCYAFQPLASEKGGREVDVVWSEKEVQKLRVPRGFEALDVWGNVLAPTQGMVAVDAQPIYLRTLSKKS